MFVFLLSVLLALLVCVCSPVFVLFLSLICVHVILFLFFPVLLLLISFVCSSILLIIQVHSPDLLLFPNLHLKWASSSITQGNVSHLFSTFSSMILSTPYSFLFLLPN